MGRAAYLWAWVMAATLVAAPASAREWVSGRGTFSFDLKGEDWVVTDKASLPKGVAFLARTPGDSTTLQVVVSPNAIGLHAFEPSAEAGLRKSVAAGGGTGFESQRKQHQGMPALDYRFEFGPVDGRQEGLARWITTADAIYTVGIVHPIGSALREPPADLFTGFRLLGRRAVPGGDKHSGRMRYLPALLRNLGIGLVLVAIVVAAMRARGHAPKRLKR